MTTAVSANPTAAGAAAQAATAKDDSGASKLAQNFDAFLTLLTTQLRYQDPLSPLESNEFIGQLVQFTSVEQAINQNQKLDEMIGLQSGNQAVGALGMIGNIATVDSGQAALAGGEARWTYTLPSDATEVTVSVLDQNNRAVYSATGISAKGAHEFVWDGTDRSGVSMPEGVYSLFVAAVDKDRNQISATTTTTGPVTGIENVGGTVNVALGKLSVPFASVRSITAPANSTAF